MSRSQQSQILNTATANSGADQTTATTAQQKEQQGVSDYETQLAGYAAKNPFLPGGEYDKATDQKLSGVADAGSAALNDALQRQAQRTGANASGAVATAAEAARQNTRDLMTGEADATQKRVAGDADYNKSVLQASEFPVQAEQGMYATGVGAANGALNTGASAAQTPGFFDTLGDSFAAALGKTAGGGNMSESLKPICWVAAELYGGWYDPRTVAVRGWLVGEFQTRWYGRPVVMLYGVVGERLAGAIRRWPSLRRVFRPMFDAALRQSQGVE